MVVQIVVIILACIVASLVAITIAGVTLAAFERFLRRTDKTAGER
ncbi:MAG TPA: hypothetical protein VNO70_02570 [Blastocatellia bacterium]|nr:hypothetical protein [Blastocatellia bacterium]